MLRLVLTVATTANGAHLESGRRSGSRRDPGNARTGPRWCECCPWSPFEKLSVLIFYVLGLQANIRLRLRISYSVAGRAVQDQVDFAGFPAGLTGGSS